MPTEFHFITAIVSKDDQHRFDRLFALYETMFPDNERHSRDAILRNIAANKTRKDGTAIWVAAENDGQMIGGIGAFIAPGAGAIEKMIVISYLFVSLQARGQKMGAGLEQALIDFSAVNNVVLVCDIEDPARMIEAGFTRAEYEESLKIAGITPFQRLGFWRDHLGYRPVDFPYVLKVNRPDAQPTSILKLHAKHVKDGAAQDLKALPSALLRNAAAVLNTQGGFDVLPHDYRTHAALAGMWAWPDSNPHCEVYPHRATKYADLEAVFAERLK